MVRQNLLNNDELIKQLEETNDVEEQHNEIQFTNNVLEFIHYAKIEPGTCAVPRKVLYRIYCSVCSNKVVEFEFHKIMSMVVEFDDGQYYLSETSYEITNRIIKIIKKTRFNLSTNQKYRKFIDNFIKNCNIKRGRTKCRSMVLFDIFKDYCREKRMKYDTWNSAPFIEILKTHFKWVREKERIFFYIENDIIPRLITKERVEQLNNKTKGFKSWKKRKFGKQQIEKEKKLNIEH